MSEDRDYIESNLTLQKQQAIESGARVAALQPNTWQGKLNAYTCDVCVDSFVTIDRDNGTTPYMTKCHRKGCDGFTRSHMYRIPQTGKARFEWFRPTKPEELPSNSIEHVANGGLILREISK